MTGKNMNNFDLSIYLAYRAGMQYAEHKHQGHDMPDMDSFRYLHMARLAVNDEKLRDAALSGLCRDGLWSELTSKVPNA